MGLTHTTPDPLWSCSFQQEWPWHLTNLAQVLETGPRKTHLRSPGINMSDFNEGIAKAMGVPVNAGIRLGFLPETGAYQAGLRKDDIIIELDGKSITNDLGFPSHGDTG